MTDPCAICGEVGIHRDRLDHQAWRERITWNEERCSWTVKETDTHLIEVTQFMYTFAIVTTVKANLGEYDDRWCYKSLPDAIKAAVEWDPAVEPEPEGWHRHPLTGRRRPDGNKSKEYINP